MEPRYIIEELVQTGPDDAGWKPGELFYFQNDAIVKATKLVKSTEHGASGVRVLDMEEQKIVWTNC